MDDFKEAFSEIGVRVIAIIIICLIAKAVVSGVQR